MADVISNVSLSRCHKAVRYDFIMSYYVCFPCEVSLIKMKINCYQQFDWILFHTRNIQINILAEAELETSRQQGSASYLKCFHVT